MTIICWDGKVLAADTQATDNSIVMHKNAQKIVRVDEYFVAGAGATADIQKLREYIRESKNGSDKAVAYPKMGDMGALVFNCQTGYMSLYVTEGLAETDLAPPVAIGTGREVAYGALDAGATAQKAVQVCIDREIYCGGRIDGVIAEWHQNSRRKHDD